MAWAAARLGLTSRRLAMWAESCALPQLEQRLQAWKNAQQQQQLQQQQSSDPQEGAAQPQQLQPGLSPLPAPQALSNLCWGLQRMGYKPSALLVQLVVECR